MKGDEKLWGILNDKLDMLRASNRLREAIRVAETALDLAQRAFKPGASNYTLSLEKLGQLYDQAGDWAAAPLFSSPIALLDSSLRTIGRPFPIEIERD